MLELFKKQGVYLCRSVSEAKKLEWNRLIEEQCQSGLSIEKWCRQQNLISHTFHYWKDKLFPK
ncbi:MAG: hypothetical protein A3D96_01640 [Chlamydiae bacterium RIFCSPHIGHO2_12_FULL_44_59]|nr:MAG: hypothetical protein A2796_01215 [Chlamydiae bacterium RIFCSPHIGHO2_01_FULL_44_39]OGN59029.1 MAG: hypothetical protein A3C42_03200 [Chlamydiae bacterium RIFCSPHIGHO2_02_FULL_45_9]OGN60561.1 MAG: hypothetical protein A3D96_01640 [Chlamydiae bacterium RIFCSPHIGHO2_12_FULL_44_59]OGN66015.1 MAG: hypothetical protein A2978_04930 [Chlamydiae bacterium RIFCSPLOWO2_01_FULL_44_52]OGN68831.1 MAG: hypothetical protein A3I67_00590 [Chlamydiae bacterium RIFCSPLOWO2_02_FULL_45_22]OGN70471.1 MAG: hyp